MDALAQYLDRHAEPTVGLVDAVAGDYRRALVVPVMAEASDCVRPVPKAAGVLTIVVVNEPRGASSAVREANAALLAALGPPRAGMFVIDATASGQPLPAGHGVGLARKLGFDLALALWACGRLAEPWIHTTDADANAPVATFDLDPKGAVAMSLPFWHEPCGDALVDEATALYELWLRYYVAGLAWAGSPWAHISLGSALAVRAEAYAAVRGMPSREAGEDFYLLAKLAKLGRVATPDVEPVRIRSRISTRVPFGTGPGVERIAAELRDGRSPRFYDPGVFAVLRDTLAALARDDDPRHEAWGAIGGPAGVAAATKSARSPAQRARRVREWLDALKTLRLIHAVETARPRLPWRDAVDRAPFCPRGRAVDDLRRALQAPPNRTEN